MADIHDSETRSFNMSQIKGSDTKPELVVRIYLHAHGLRFRLHQKELPGKPDIILPKYNTVIFVNGCFWHSHMGCRYFVVPKTRTEWWMDKLQKNAKRDTDNLRTLTSMGWNTITVWECELKTATRSVTLEKIYNSIISK